jgi:HTH-type transcriptional regulator/antitoxin HigA
MNNMSRISSNWVSPPGATLVDFVDEQGKTLVDLANEMNCQVSFLKSIVNGTAAINSELALALSRVTGVSSNFWLNREKQYRDHLVRIELLRADENSWLSNLPTADMANFGWIEKANSKPKKLLNCLLYFGVASVEEWRSRYGNLISETAFRISDRFSQKQESIAAWLRQGELQVANHLSEDWNKDKLIEVIPRLRDITNDPNPSSFIPKLRATLSTCGVLLAIVKSPQHCPASGAAYWLGGKKPLIILSFKYLSDDHFWFTFFHEIAHLILHTNYSLILESGDSNVSNIEQEANSYSENILIPKIHQSEFLQLNPKNLRGILKFSKKIGVSKGIVVGQLQHKSIIPGYMLNKLKVRYSWTNFSH